MERRSLSKSDKFVDKIESMLYYRTVLSKFLFYTRVFSPDPKDSVNECF